MTLEKNRENRWRIFQNPLYLTGIMYKAIVIKPHQASSGNIRMMPHDDDDEGDLGAVEYD